MNVSRFETVEDAFKALNQTGIPYVVFENFQPLPHSYGQGTNRLQMLTQSLEGIEKVWDLNREAQSACLRQLVVGRNNSTITVPMAIWQKGKGLFPEAFESALLANPYNHNGCIKTADEQKTAPAILYRHIVHGRPIYDAGKVLIEEYLKNTIGVKKITDYRKTDLQY